MDLESGPEFYERKGDFVVFCIYAESFREVEWCDRESMMKGKKKNNFSELSVGSLVNIILPFVVTPFLSFIHITVD